MREARGVGADEVAALADETDRNAVDRLAAEFDLNDRIEVIAREFGVATHISIDKGCRPKMAERLASAASQWSGKSAS